MYKKGEILMKENWKKYLAECIGTAVLTLAACGVAVVAQTNLLGIGGWWVATSFAFGLVIVAMVYSIGNISGCHINPAVAAAIQGDLTSLSQIWIWILAPLAGAALAAVVYGLLTKGKEEKAE